MQRRSYTKPIIRATKDHDSHSSRDHHDDDADATGWSLPGGN